jgi:hypothetical protein
MGGGAGGDFRLRVRVPISGTVAERNFVPGGRVAAGEPLFTIVDPRRVWLRVRLPAAAASAVPRDARASFTVEGTPRTFSTGPLVAVGSVLDPESRTVPATFQVENAGGLIKIGQFARASVPVGGTVRGVAIPNQAILDDNGTPVAYVQTEGETFERRVLTLGESDGERTQVMEGIRPGEMVVTTGAYQVRLASLSPEGFSGGLQQEIDNHARQTNPMVAAQPPAGGGLVGAATGRRHVHGEPNAGRRLPRSHRAHGDGAHRSPRDGAGRGGNPRHLPGGNRR